MPLKLLINFSDWLWTQDKTSSSASSISPLLARDVAERMNSEMLKMCLTFTAIFTAIFMECRKRSGIALVLHFFAFWLVHSLNQSGAKTNLSIFLAYEEIAAFFYFDFWLDPYDISSFRRDLFPFGFTTVNRIAFNANLTQLMIYFSALAYGRQPRRKFRPRLWTSFVNLVISACQIYTRRILNICCFLIKRYDPQTLHFHHWGRKKEQPAAESRQVDCRRDS